MLSKLFKLLKRNEKSSRYIEELEKRCELLQEKVDNVHYINDDPCLYKVTEYRGVDSEEAKTLGRYQLTDSPFVDINIYLSRLLDELNDPKNAMFFVNTLHSAYKENILHRCTSVGYSHGRIDIISIYALGMNTFGYAGSATISFRFKRKLKKVEVVYQHATEHTQFIKFIKSNYGNQLHQIVVAMNKLIDTIY